MLCRYFYYAHFTDEEIEAKRKLKYREVNKVTQVHTSSRWWSHNSNQEVCFRIRTLNTILFSVKHGSLFSKYGGAEHFFPVFSICM